MAPSFEHKFARLTYIGGGRFSLAAMRHTEEWMEIFPRSDAGRVPRGGSKRSLVSPVTAKNKFQIFVVDLSKHTC